MVKNKVAPPFREADFDILYGEGISREGEIIELGVLHKIVDKSGAWYSYGKERIGQGKDNTRDYLKEHPEMAQEIEAKIRAAMGVGAGAESAEPQSRKNRPAPGTCARGRCGMLARREYSRLELERKLAPFAEDPQRDSGAAR